MDSTLRPRDIQARIRSGETPESVAQVAGTSVDKVMPYAAPVLAERAHVAQRAQRASIRRRPTESGRRRRPDPRRGRRQPPARSQRRPRHRRLGRLAPRGRPLDADRRPTRPATGSAPPTSPSTPRATTSSPTTTTPTGCSARSPTRPEADEAEGLAGDDLSTARRRRLSAVPPEELPLGEDALELVSEDPARSPTLEVAPTRSRPAEETAALGAEAPLEAYLDEPPADTGTTSRPSTPTPTADSDDRRRSDDDHPHEPPSRKPVKKTRGRASVPSWDEIMFGGGSSQD